MRVIISGTRNPKKFSYWQFSLILKEILDVHAYGILREKVTIIEGGAQGIDSYAERFALGHGQPHEQYPAQWAVHGKLAGTMRNKQMLASGADLVVAFPSDESIGTWHMINISKKAGTPVEVIEI